MLPLSCTLSPVINVIVWAGWEVRAGAAVAAAPPLVANNAKTVAAVTAYLFRARIHTP
ncbi:hypothetical protein GCM10009765_70600 [Fodinicola feengrottensis]|uniref:Uncharacterized protein n=1 Tax=Fodinicola feengrottensis TaxID=435914 RepID=A0ABN2IT27_9ACTN